MLPHIYPGLWKVVFQRTQLVVCSCTNWNSAPISTIARESLS